MGRILTIPLPTIAAINGHCYAGGVFIALCCDWRVMLDNCGDVCLSEIHLGLSFPIGFREMIAFKMTPTALRTAVLRGYRFTAKEALEANIIDHVVMRRQDLIKRSVDLAKSVSFLSKNRRNYLRLKQDLYKETIAALEHAANNIGKQPSKM